MPRTVKLEDVELELPDETVETLELYGYEPEKAVAEHLKTQIIKNTGRLSRNRCPKCGKPTERTLTYSQAKAVNAGEETLEDLGVCTCSD